MEKIRILCYGDSNTWGYIPASDHLRYDINTRWTRLLAKRLGDSYEIIEEGLNSRTLISNDPRPGKEGKSGYDYLIPCLDSQDPIDLVILMLGTNELKYSNNKTPEEIGTILEEKFVKVILNRKSQISNKYPKLLIVTPPLVNEDADEGTKQKYLNATKKSYKLNEIYKEIAIKNNCYFVDNEGLTPGIDGIHLNEEKHKLLAEKIYNKITKIYNKGE